MTTEPQHDSAASSADGTLGYIQADQLAGVSARTLQRIVEASDGADDLPGGQSTSQPAVETARLDRVACPDEHGNDGEETKGSSATNACPFARFSADGKATRFSESSVVTATIHPQIDTGEDIHLMAPSHTARLVAPRQDESPPSLPLIEVLTVDRKDLVKMLRVSESTIKRLDSSNDIPGRCKILGSVRYDRSEIEKWVAEGCPRRADRAKAARARRVGKR